MSGLPEMSELRAKTANVSRTGRILVLTIRCFGGVVVSFPLARIKSFTSARIRAAGDAIYNVRVRDFGHTMAWPDLGVDFSVAEMVPEYLGITSVQASARRAGSVRSNAKAAAARTNGARGGRPKKKDAAAWA